MKNHKHFQNLFCSCFIVNLPSSDVKHQKTTKTSTLTLLYGVMWLAVSVTLEDLLNSNPHTPIKKETYSPAPPQSSTASISWYTITVIHTVWIVFWHHLGVYPKSMVVCMLHAVKMMCDIYKILQLDILQHPLPVLILQTQALVISNW